MTDVRRPAPAFAPPEWVRVVVPAIVAAVVQVGITLIASRHQQDARSLDAGGIALLLAGPAALLLRRRQPSLTLLLTFVPTMAYWLTDYPRGPIFLSLLIAFVTVVMRGQRALAWASLGVGYVLTAWVKPYIDHDVAWPDWGLAAALAAWLLFLGAFTELARSWRERAAERARARAEEARRRAGEERLRIARELHDVLAHNISLINVRAGVALHLVDERPDQIEADQVRPALAAIKDASKDALGELRSVLDVLRQGEAAPLAPTAGLSDLDALAERARGTGLDVRVERQNGTGAAVSAVDMVSGLPAGVDLAAFRVAQEALTNVVRHAEATRVSVRVRRTDDELEVRVDDDGGGTAAAGRTPATDARAVGPGSAGGRTRGWSELEQDDLGRDDAPRDDARRDDVERDDGGRGIAGMRERAHALGGSLDAGPRPGRGFRVRARFPLRGNA